ncbi:MAG TPA: hemolysin family protein [Verrucomicrobiae bacterium]|nr:hemolysin family protein [Verrucomicrobiae bacterium]
MGLAGYVVIAGVLLFAAASFFFAVAESSLFSLGMFRARQVNNPRVHELLEKPSELLATIVLGNTIANGGLVALALWPALRGKWPEAWSVAGALVVVLVGCEVLPKTLALRAPERWALRVAGPMTFLQGATGWFQQLIQRFNQWMLQMMLPKAARQQTSHEEYEELLELAYQHGALRKSELDLIVQIINLDRKTVAEIMKPRAQMAAIPDDLSVEEMVDAARKYQHNRLPMYDETPDTIVGILNTRTLLLDPNVDLAEAIEFPSFVPKSMNLLELLKSFQKQQRDMAIVLDEFGGTAGLVTMEDILEAVVGDIRAEGEIASADIEQIGPGKWRVAGTATLEDFRREYPALGEVSGALTMGGVMLMQAEVVPSAGQTVQFRGLRLTAEMVDERRVKQIVVEVVKKK